VVKSEQEDFISSEQSLELRRFQDSLFLLHDDGTLGQLDPHLRFSINDRPWDVAQPLALDTLKCRRDEREFRITVDRSQAGYDRNWPAYLRRRWDLRRGDYERFVTSALEQEYGAQADQVLQLDTPTSRERFLRAVATRIYHAPYETYSRYREPYPPMKGCDRALDSILEGDGGICVEKAMVLYFIVRAYGIPSELVLGGENAAGAFPYRALRGLLDQPSFDFGGTEPVQRFWQHFAVLCQLDDTGGQPLLCDVANSNIPLVLWRSEKAFSYLRPRRKRPLRVRVTIKPIDLYYHRIQRYQDVPLDLYYAMEHFIDFVDLIQTIDNELGLIITRDFWIGVIAYVTSSERDQILRGYHREVVEAHQDPRADLHFTPDLSNSSHPLVRQFGRSHAAPFAKIAEIDSYLRRRVARANPLRQYELEYVVLRLPHRKKHVPKHDP
jgi:hypothetical protein